MAEDYAGTKFTTRFLENRIPDSQGLGELEKWCKRFSKLGLAPSNEFGGAGNMSFRKNDGFIITATASDLGKLKKEEFVEVISVDREHTKIVCRGLKEPSSEAFIHDAIYKERSDIQAIFHAHDELVLNRALELRVPVTNREQPYGTLSLMNEVINILHNHLYIIIRNHGFLSLGKTMDQAGKEALRKHKQALDLIPRHNNQYL